MELPKTLPAGTLIHCFFEGANTRHDRTSVITQPMNMPEVLAMAQKWRQEIEGFLSPMSNVVMLSINIIKP